MKRIARAIGFGLAWAVAWAPVAVLIGTLIIDPDDSMDEMWVTVGAYPGFLCGVVFFALLATAERGRGLHEMWLPRAGAWGALAGLLVGVFPFIAGTPTSAIPLWLLGLGVIGSITAMSAVSAVGSAVAARMRNKRRVTAATRSAATAA